MFYHISEYITRDLEFQRKKLKEYSEEIGRLPKGGLSVSQKKGKQYYSKVETYRGKQRVKYLGAATHPEVQLLQKKYFIRKDLWFGSADR